MPKSETHNPKPLDHEKIPTRPAKAPYPPPYNECFDPKMTWKPVGALLGLKNFGVNIVTLPPGARSSERHWHKSQDEYVYILQGEVTVISEAGETTAGAGMSLGFRAGVPDGHTLVNNTDAPVTYLCVGDRAHPEHVTYPDADMQLIADEAGVRFMHNDGSPYPDEHQPKFR